MMLTTHVLAGIALALPVVVFAPEFGPVALLAGAVGGAFPDFDMYWGHRRTLHFPVYYPIAAVPAALLATIAPSVVAVGIAVALAAAALHCVMDVYGGGLELRPWEERSKRGVYDHYHGRWITPRRLLRYDGSPEDLLLAGAFAVPTLLLVDGALPVVALLLGISAVYVGLRKQLASLAPDVFALTPEPLRGYVPERYQKD